MIDISDKLKYLQSLGRPSSRGGKIGADLDPDGQHDVHLVGEYLQRTLQDALTVFILGTHTLPLIG